MRRHQSESQGFCTKKHIMTKFERILNKIKISILRIAFFEKKSINKVLSKNNQEKLRNIIVNSESKEGRFFDITLVVLIMASVLVVMIETLPEIHSKYYLLFYGLEWVFTILFMIEYFIRIYAARNPLKYIFSFFGIIDLMSFLPTFLSIFVIGLQHFLILRIFRLLRIFRIFKLSQFVNEGGIVVQALKASSNKIYIFISFILLISVLIGSAMFMIEGQVNANFRSIPHSIYWAITTLSTVGYGDLVPVTGLGRVLASIVMILSYALIAVPTGIVTAEISNRVLRLNANQLLSCPNCMEINHLSNAKYCHNCGNELHHKHTIYEDIELEKRGKMN